MILASFCSPESVDANAFRQVFADPTHTDKKAIFEPADGVDTAALSHFCESAMHLAVLSGVDNNPQNLACAGSLAPGQQHDVVYLRFQFNAAKNLYRLVVRSRNADILDAFIDAAAKYLAKNGHYDPA